LSGIAGKTALVTTESLHFLLLFYAITAVAVIGTLNAQKGWRYITCLVLAVSCLGVAGFQTYRFFVPKESVMEMLTTPGGVPAAAPQQAQDLPPTFAVAPQDSSAMYSESGQGSGSAQAMSSSEFREIIAAARQLYSDLSAVDFKRVGRMSDAEYTRIQDNARDYLENAKSLKSRATAFAAQSPSGLESQAALLSNAVTRLVSAAGDFQGFFNASSGSEERTRSASMRSNLKDASETLSKLESR
jgi:hypothetical protein